MTSSLPSLADFLRLTGFTPFRIVETPDYAEIHAANGDGKHAFALTTSPSFFLELNALSGPLADLVEGGLGSENAIPSAALHGANTSSEPSAP